MKKTFRYSQSTLINSNDTETFELSYDEVNDLFNQPKYDGLYILNLSGEIVSAYNKKDGIIIDNKFIPKEKKDEVATIYGTNDKLYDGFNNIIITISNNKYDVNLFKLECVGIDKYILFLSNIGMNIIDNKYIENQQRINDYNDIEDDNKMYKKAI